MADFTTIKEEIDANIVPFNDAQEITGEKLNVTLKDMLDAVADAIDAGFQFLGRLPEDFDPSAVTPAGKVWYLATPAEYYGIEEIVSSGHIAIMSYDGTEWNFTDYDLIQNGYVDTQTFDFAVSDFISRLDTKVDSVVDSTPDNLPAFDGPNGVLKDSGVSVDDLAKKDGYYDTLGAGYAKTLLGNGAAVDAEFLYRTTGGGASVADGIASLKKFEGNTIGWNQLVDTDTESVSLVSGHKYLTIVGGEASIVTGAGSAIEVEGGTDMVFDLTLMGGLFASLEGDTGVATFRSFFPKPSYPYNAGQLLSVMATGIKTTGRNQWDEEWRNDGYYSASGIWTAGNFVSTRNPIAVIPNSDYYFYFGRSGAALAITYWDANMGFISRVSGVQNSVIRMPSNCYYVHFNANADYGTTYNHDICINLSDPSFNGQYFPYEEHLLSLPITSVTGKVNGQGTSEVVFPEGMRSAGTAFDELTDLRDGYFHGARKRMGKVDLGTLNWEGGFYGVAFRSFGITNEKEHTDNTFGNYVMANYEQVKFGYAAMPNKSFVFSSIAHTPHTLAIRDDSYSTAEEFKAAMSGVYLIYELATPVDYVLDTPIPCNYQVCDWGTEEVQPVGTDENGVPMTAPIRAGIVYGPNVQDTIRRLPQDYISKGSMENLLNAFKTAGIISAFTMTFDSASQKYNFTITAPTNE